MAYEAYLDKTNPPDSRPGATIGESFEKKFTGRDELDAVQALYEILSGVPANRRARVFQYVSQVLGEDE